MSGPFAKPVNVRIWPHLKSGFPLHTEGFSFTPINSNVLDHVVAGIVGLPELPASPSLR
jgi:hypothetical protein